ncbi:MAG: DNA repair protein RecN [Alkalinema sp. RU_4_3]|nr:DNA repair protein RecN [Alkalinema sp. RU_4_3]
MLLSLRIENFALIDALSLEFGAGLNVLTGETGAGKSIILDAIDAVLGGKVSGRAVRTGRTGNDRGQFQMRPDVAAWCEQENVEPSEDGILTCSREITGNRSKSRVNGIAVNKQQMESLRDRLVEITAQGQTVQLGNPAVQRDWLDSFTGSAAYKQREKVAILQSAHQQAVKQLDQRRKVEASRQQQLDMFEYQLRELKEAMLTEPDELEQLENERNRLSYSVDLQQQSYQAYQLLYQNETGEAQSCSDLLGDAEQLLLNMVEVDTSLQSVLDAITNAMALVNQAGREINLYGSSIEADPERLEEVQTRVSFLKTLLRRYGPELSDAIAQRDHLQGQVDDLTGNGQSLEELEAAVARAKQELTEACAVLTNLRRVGADKLEKQLVTELKPLAMDKVQFRVALEPIAPTSMGADRIVYMFSPNPGEPLQPLIDVASGGEMSRFLLALQSCFSQVDSVGTLVFDEIDAGVSGTVAGAIAEKLHQLSQFHQVMCVTHQPLIAAMADLHYRVNKEVIDANGKVQAANSKKKGKDDDLRTVVRIMQLDHEQRREELALIAGGSAAEAAYGFADELLVKAAQMRDGAIVEPKKAGRKKAGRKKSKASWRGGVWRSKNMRQ